ncbi:MAG: type II toxin-antitoxin system RelE/ParE family toxin [Roseburia sp.]|nr:type II toxin-antitoxin system RelE/ParE family toxin [Roseburia sp.]
MTITRKGEERTKILQIEYSKKAIKYINSLDRPTKKRLREAIERIPYGDIKKLQGVKNGFRLRVGDLRVLFTPEHDKIFIDNVIPRGQAYDRI